MAKNNMLVLASLKFRTYQFDTFSAAFDFSLFYSGTSVTRVQLDEFSTVYYVTNI